MSSAGDLLKSAVSQLDDDSGVDLSKSRNITGDTSECTEQSINRSANIRKLSSASHENTRYSTDEAVCGIFRSCEGEINETYSNFQDDSLAACSSPLNLTKNDISNNLCAENATEISIAEKPVNFLNKSTDAKSHFILGITDCENISQNNGDYLDGNETRCEDAYFGKFDEKLDHKFYGSPTITISGRKNNTVPVAPLITDSSTVIYDSTPSNHNATLLTHDSTPSIQQSTNLIQDSTCLICDSSEKLSGSQTIILKSPSRSELSNESKDCPEMNHTGSKFGKSTGLKIDIDCPEMNHTGSDFGKSTGLKNNIATSYSSPVLNECDEIIANDTINELSTVIGSVRDNTELANDSTNSMINTVIPPAGDTLPIDIKNCYFSYDGMHHDTATTSESNNIIYPSCLIERDGTVKYINVAASQEVLGIGSPLYDEINYVCDNTLPLDNEINPVHNNGLPLDNNTSYVSNDELIDAKKSGVEIHNVLHKSNSVKEDLLESKAIIEESMSQITDANHDAKKGFYMFIEASPAKTAKPPLNSRKLSGVISDKSSLSKHPLCKRSNSEPSNLVSEDASQILIPGSVINGRPVIDIPEKSCTRLNPGRRHYDDSRFRTIVISKTIPAITADKSICSPDDDNQQDGAFIFVENAAGNDASNVVENNEFPGGANSILNIQNPNNCFIDASSLLDDNDEGNIPEDYVSLPNMSFHCDRNENNETQTGSKKVDVEISRTGLCELWKRFELNDIEKDSLDKNSEISLAQWKATSSEYSLKEIPGGHTPDSLNENQKNMDSSCFTEECGEQDIQQPHDYVIDNDLEGLSNDIKILEVAETSVENKCTSLTFDNMNEDEKSSKSNNGILKNAMSTSWIVEFDNDSSSSATRPKVIPKRLKSRAISESVVDRKTSESSNIIGRTVEKSSQNSRREKLNLNLNGSRNVLGNANEKKSCEFFVNLESPLNANFQKPAVKVNDAGPSNQLFSMFINAGKTPDGELVPTVKKSNNNIKTKVFHSDQLLSEKDNLNPKNPMNNAIKPSEKKAMLLDANRITAPLKNELTDTISKTSTRNSCASTSKKTHFNSTTEKSLPFINKNNSWDKTISSINNNSSRDKTVASTNRKSSWDKAAPSMNDNGSWDKSQLSINDKNRTSKPTNTGRNTYAIRERQSSNHHIKNEQNVGTQSFNVNIKSNQDSYSSSREVKMDINISVSGAINMSSRHSLSNVAELIKNNAGAKSSRQLFEDNSSSEFVKLSDMDKGSVARHTGSLDRATTSQNRLTRSIPEGSSNWLQNKLQSGAMNSRSLSRIFPHLSTSVANSDADDTTPSTSSMHSSMEPSLTYGSGDENGSGGARLQENNCSARLGDDLLRMFLDEISTDVTVEVAGRRIRAHKCILTSRCQYFAAMLSGGWVESAGDVISLQGFSYNVVHFALCHIYSGESVIPESINVVELATLADMLCLEGLKEVITYTLKMKYCHFFHKPCNICSVGVLECLPLAVAYNLDEIYYKSLRWVTKHYLRIWPSRAFASLPRDIMEKCYRQHIIDMDVNNVLETLNDCDQLTSTIPKARWSEVTVTTVAKLHDHCVQYIAQHFMDFINSDSFSSLAVNHTWDIATMEQKIELACEKMTVDQICCSYTRIHQNLKIASSTCAPRSEEFVELLVKVKNLIENSLIKQAHKACQCSSWYSMESELRHKIQMKAGLIFLPDSKKQTKPSTRQRPKPDNATASLSRSVNLEQVTSAMHRQVTTTTSRSSTTSSKSSALFNKSESSSRKSVSLDSSQMQAISTQKPKSCVKLANVKSRYMDVAPRRSDDKSASSGSSNALSTSFRNVISSSESSRNLSPALSRRKLASETKSKNSPAQNVSQSKKSPSKVASAERVGKSCDRTAQNEGMCSGRMSQSKPDITTNKRSSQNITANRRLSQTNRKTSPNVASNQRTSQNVATNGRASQNVSTNGRTSQNITTNTRTSQNVATNERTSLNAVTNGRTSQNVATNGRTSQNVATNGRTSHTPADRRQRTSLTSKRTTPTSDCNASLAPDVKTTANKWGGSPQVASGEQQPTPTRPSLARSGTFCKDEPSTSLLKKTPQLHQDILRHF